MNANEKIRARYRAREAQAKANEKRCRRDRANADNAATIRAMLHRVGAVDSWERKRLDQAAEHVRADAAKRRASYFSGLQAAVDLKRPGSGGGSGYWISTRVWSVRFVA
jgi:hypothetical protein